MLSLDQLDRLICTLSGWDHDLLVAAMDGYGSDFPLDLSAEFLKGLPVDKVRHLFFAVCVQNRRLPAGVVDGSARVRAA